MITFRAIFCLLLLNSLTNGNPARSNNFEDADRGTDFTSSFGDSDQQWDIRHNIPGEPEIDYPIYSVAPKTSFTCDSRHEGYYADVETRCQVFRICTNTDLTGDGFAFLCPNGTLFSQRHFVCDWYRNVNCEESESYYFMNEKLGKIIQSEEDMMKAVKEMVDYPVKKVTTVFGQSTQPKTSSVSPFQKSNSQSSSSKGTSATNNKSPDHTKSTTDRSRTDSNNRNANTKQTTTTGRRVTDNHQTRNGSGHKNDNGRNGNNNRNRNDNHNHNRNQDKSTHQTDSNNHRPHTSSSGGDFDRNKFSAGGKIYVSNLGELSTDVGSTFDPKTSVIIADAGKESTSSSDRYNQKKSLDQYLGNVQNKNEAANNLEKNSQRIRTSLPGSINSNFNSPEDPPKENGSYNPNAAKGRLNFAEKINAGLNGFPVTGSGEDPAGTNRQKILSKTVYSGEGDLISQFFGRSQKPERTGRLFNLAESINSAFGTTGKAQNNGVVVSGEDILSQPHSNTAHTSIDSTRKDVQGHFVRPQETTLPPRTTTHQPPTTQHQTSKAPVVASGFSFRQGRQRYELQGSGFSRQGQFATVTTPRPTTPFRTHPTQSKSYYLPPPPPQRSQPARFQHPSSTSNARNKETRTFQSGFKLSIEDSLSELTTLRSTERDDIGTIPSLLIDDQDKNAVEDIKPASANGQDIHVKKRAENLLLQGVHLTLYELNNSTVIDDNSIDNILNITPAPRTTISISTQKLPDVEQTTTTASTILTTTEIFDDDDTFEITTTYPIITTFKSDLNITTSTELPDRSLENTTISQNLTISENSTISHNFTSPQNSTTISNTILNARRQTAKPINYSKKPFTARSYPKTTTTIRPIKFRRRPTSRRFTLNLNNTNNDENQIQDNDATEHDLITNANSYGVRANLNRIQNETNKYTVLRRPKLNYSYDDRKLSYSLKNRTRSPLSNLNITTIPTTTTSTSPKPSPILLQNDTNPQGTQTSVNQGLPQFKQNTGSTAAHSPVSLHPGQAFRTSFPLTQPGHQDVKQQKTTSYVPLPGTRVTIAKSEEGASYTISNDPLYTRQPQQQIGQQNNNISKKPTTQTFTNPTGTPQFKQHPYLPLEQFLTSGFPSSTHSPVQSTNFFLPFPTISPSRNLPTNGNHISTFPPLPPVFNTNIRHQVSHITTPSPYINIQPVNTFYLNDPTERTTYFEGIGGGAGGSSNGHSLNNFPFLNQIQQAQRRLDVVDDEDEGSIFKGVSSYQVPLKSVGRLPGDIKGVKR